MVFQFEMKLSRMALLAYALSLWKKGDMPRKLKQFYYPCGRRGKMPFLQELIDEVIKSIDRTSLPSPLYHELLDVVKGVAYKTYNWFNFIRRKKVFRDQSRRQIYDKFLKDVYWTHYGTIDEVKIIKYSWLKIPNVDLTKLYVMACNFCSEELINEVWGKSKGELSIGNDELCNVFGFHLVIYWNKLREKKLEDVMTDCIVPFAEDPYSVYDVNQSVESNMLRMAVYKGFSRAVKYFWNKLSQQDRNKNIKDYLTVAFGQYEKKLDFEYYKRDQYAEIIFFLMNFSNEVLNKEIFTDKNPEYKSDGTHQNLINILELCTDFWPWIEFVNPLFRQVENFLNDEVCGCFLNDLMKRSSGPDSLFHSLLRQVWNRVSFECKVSAIRYNYLSSLLKNWDLAGIKFIVNDKTLTFCRNDIIKHFHKAIISMIRNNEFDKLRQFINEILIPVCWSEEIHDAAKSLYGHILKGEINLANDCLNSIPEEKIESIKSDIDSDIICYYFVIRNEFDLANQFLRWKYGAYKVHKFKDDFKKKDFVIDQIRYLWKVPKEKVEITKTNCDNFLLWFLNDEVDVFVFKATAILPKLFLCPWTCLVDMENHFDVLHDFLHWILLSDKAIEMYKIKVFKKTSNLANLLPELVKTGRFEELTKICKWAFDSDDKMSKYLKDFLLSNYGILVCKLFITKHSSPNMFDQPTKEEMIGKFKNFIDFLIKPLKNFSEFRKKLQGWPDDSKRIFERIDTDAESTEDFNSDDSGGEDDVNWVYCKIDNYNLFWSLLSKVENDTDDL